MDDGKSTLIGRLLHDSKSIFEDQLEHIASVSKRRGHDYVDLALLTDGLRAEREQGITIDVAYRYFSTPHRDFVIADCPGHVQYTRNMITGVSRADLAIVLVDARHGVVEQTRRHSLLASLLRVPHLVIGVNKMDLVDHSEERFDEIAAEFAAFAADLDLDHITFIPISALVGDNVVERSTSMDWYSGPTLLHHLETVSIGTSDDAVGARFPVQYVIRPHRAEFRDYRGYAGTVAAGTISPGDEVVVLPSGVRTTITSIDTADGPVAVAGPERAVTVVLADDVDVSRGDLLASPDDQPVAVREVTAVLAWMDGQRAALDAAVVHVEAHDPRGQGDGHGRAPPSRRGRARRATRRRHAGAQRDRTRVTEADGADPRRRLPPQPVDGQFRADRRGDPPDRRRRHDQDVTASSNHVSWHDATVGRAARWERHGLSGATVWFTGLSGSGKSTLANVVAARLLELGRPAYVLDGDNVRHGLNADLGFSASDRGENVRRVGEVAALMADAGLVVLVPVISPYRADRDRVRAAHVSVGLPFVEVFVDTPLEVCEERDPKGLYAKARAGEITGMTGIDDPYEPPERPELQLRQVATADRGRRRHRRAGRPRRGRCHVVSHRVSPSTVRA